MDQFAPVSEDIEFGLCVHEEVESVNVCYHVFESEPLLTHREQVTEFSNVSEGSVLFEKSL